MNNLIGSYVSKLTINNINDFGLKNNINLNKKELNVLLELVKSQYNEILSGNDENAKDILKKHLTSENYEKVINLYNEYRNKYQGYLK